MSILRRPTSLWVFLVIFFTTFGQLWALEPSQHITQYGHTVWRVQDGYFGGGLFAIAQTTDGYIWVGTDAGLFKFDGVRFARWDEESSEELPSSRVSDLLAARDGSLWVAGNGGLARIVDHRVTVFSAGWLIASPIEDRDGNIWFERNRPGDWSRPLCKIASSSLRCYGAEDGLQDIKVSTLVQDLSGNLWLGGSTSLVRWRPGNVSIYRPRSLQSKDNATGVAALLASGDGSLWVGMAPVGPGGGLQRMVNGTLSPFIAPNLNGQNLEVQALLTDRDGSLWVGTHQSGLCRIHGSQVESYGAKDGLSGDSVYSVFEDREGNIWVATSGGLDMFRDLRIKEISNREGLLDNGVESVAAAQDGAVWIGTEHLQLLGPHGDSIDARRSVPGTQITSLFVDSSGRLWAGMDDKLYVRIDGRFHEVARQDGHPFGMAMGITEDSDHTIWAESAGPPGMLVKIWDFKVQQEFPEPSTPLARKIVADPQSGIWLGLVTGDLAHYRDGQITTFTFGDHPNSRVQAITVTPDGAILGGTPFGVVGWKEGNRQILTTKNGLPCDDVRGLISDEAGDLWLFASCGLIEIPKDQIQKWWQNSGSKLSLRLFDAIDGVQPGLAHFNTSAKTPDGRLWFANGNVLQVVNPARLTGNTLAPPVYISGLVADRKPYEPQSDIRLPPHTRDLEINYTALSYTAPQKVRFRYMLEGHDAAWQDPGTRRQAFYNDLRPAHYRFHVIACNNDGIWNNEGASVEFSIAPAWYQANWFLLLCGAAALLALWSFYRFRVRRVAHAIGVRFDERLAERTRMARELHDTFLQTIQGSKLVVDDALKKPGDHDRMQRAMEQLAAWLDQAVLEGRAALNSLRASTTQGNDLSAALKRAGEECRLQGSMEIVFSVTGATQQMHPAVRDEIYRIGYEAIRNACSHSKASRLEISLRYGRELALRVIDNGVGIDPLTADHGRDGHFGIPGMRERATRISSKLTVASSPNFGTEITLVVPGKIVFITSDGGIFGKLTAIVKRKSSRSTSE